MFQSLSRIIRTEVNMSDYREGFNDGVKHARELLVEALTELMDRNDEPVHTFQDIADLIEGDII